MEIVTFLFFHCSAVSRLALCFFFLLLIAEYSAKSILAEYFVVRERESQKTHSSETRLKNCPKVYVALFILYLKVARIQIESVFFSSLVVFGCLGNILAFIDCEQITVKRIANHKLCLLFNEMVWLLLIYLQGTKPTPIGTSEFYLETSTMDRRPTLLALYSLFFHIRSSPDFIRYGCRRCENGSTQLVK